MVGEGIGGAGASFLLCIRDRDTSAITVDNIPGFTKSARVGIAFADY
jgi:hypothetical protein